MIEDRALRICWNILDKMKLNEVILISKYAPNNPDLFIECAKKYEDCFGTILFSNNYKKIKKVMSFAEIQEKFVNLKD